MHQGRNIIQDRRSIKRFFRSDPALKGYWPLQDLKDLSGNANHGTATGAVAGGIGGLRGYYFDGSDDYITWANESNFDFERTDSFSFVGTIYNLSVDNAGIFVKQDSALSYRGFQLYVTTAGRLYLMLRNTVTTNYLSAYSELLTCPLGKIATFVVTYNGTSTVEGVNFYANGRKYEGTGTTNLTDTILNNTAMTSGARNTGGAVELDYTGIQSELAVFKRELSIRESIEYTKFASNMFV
jgi:hypothetical protein